MKGSKKLQLVQEKFSFSITKQMEALAKPGCPISKQFHPTENELNTQKEELQDPIGDDSHSPVKGIVHRYPDRCLLMPITVCPVYCRFCFRREKVSRGEMGLNNSELKNALAYIKNEKKIFEVILTGGDPLFMTPKRIQSIIQELSAIEHLAVIRIHTRVPVVDSKKINDQMLRALKTKKALYIILHTNHPKELTDAAREAAAKLINSGIPLLSQSVLLKGINNDEKTLETLFRELVKMRIKPYYLHHADMAEGTSHFRTTIEEGQSLMKKLRGRLSGLCQPTYVLDIPGGFGKTPIAETMITPLSRDQYLIEDYRGKYHHYSASGVP